MKVQNKNFINHIGQTFLSHIYGIVFSLIISLALSSMSQYTFGLILCAIFSIITYSIPTYMKLWNIGSRHASSMKLKHKKPQILYGFKVSIVSNLPWFLLGGILIISKLGLLDFSIVFYKLINPHLWQIINFINPSASFDFFSVNEIFVIAIILPLIPVLIQGVSFILGVKNIVFLEKLLYKSKKSIADK